MFYLYIAKYFFQFLRTFSLFCSSLIRSPGNNLTSQVAAVFFINAIIRTPALEYENTSWGGFLPQWFSFEVLIAEIGIHLGNLLYFGVRARGKKVME